MHHDNRDMIPSARSWHRTPPMAILIHFVFPAACLQEGVHHKNFGAAEFQYRLGFLGLERHCAPFGNRPSGWLFEMVFDLRLLFEASQPKGQQTAHLKNGSASPCMTMPSQLLQHSNMSSQNRIPNYMWLSASWRALTSQAIRAFSAVHPKEPKHVVIRAWVSVSSTTLPRAFS